MASELGGSTNRSSSFSSSDTTGFECNICFDLAQDPIVTLCGHLFCWPCLYEWLSVHSRSKDCPVCKAVIEEEKLVPLYGRGKSSSDPRSKSIPHRPTGQRPETAPPPEPNLFHHPHHHHHHGFGFMGSGGLAGPMASARFGNFTFSAALGGLIPSLLNLQFSDPANLGFVGGGFPHRLSNPFHGLNLHRQFHHHHHQQQPRHAGQRNQQDYVLKRLLVIILVFVFVTLILQ